MVLEQSFFLYSVPFVCLLPLLSSGNATRRTTKKILWIHLFLSVTFVCCYVFVRKKFGENFADKSDFISKPIYNQYVNEFHYKKCKMLHFRPSVSVRRILLFPGLGISVRQMMQETCMLPFLNDSEVLCFQIRGLGESGWDVDLSAKSMLQDALNAVEVFASITKSEDRSLFIGYSLGCFVGMQLLSHLPKTHVVCNNILLVNGMYDGKNMVSKYKILSSLLHVTVKPHVCKSTVPITIIHSKSDATISISEAIDLKRECDSIKRRVQLFVMEGGHSHYTISDKIKSRLTLL